MIGEIGVAIAIVRAIKGKSKLFPTALGSEIKSKKFKPETVWPPPGQAIPLPAAPIVYWAAARRDGAVWAGPWKSDGVGFTRVPKNYWKFKSREAAQQAIDSDRLENCEPQELDPE